MGYPKGKYLGCLMDYLTESLMDYPKDLTMAIQKDCLKEFLPMAMQKEFLLMVTLTDYADPTDLQMEKYLVLLMDLTKVKKMAYLQMAMLMVK